MGIENDLVTISISALAAAVILLTYWETRRYLSERQLPHLYWATGLLLVAVTLSMEVLFYLGAWSQTLIRSYLLLVAVLVAVLSMGSAELSLGRLARRLYGGYAVVACAVAAVLVLGTPQSPSILSGGIVTGYPGLGPTLASVFVTVPASILMAASSLRAAYVQRRWRPAWTAAGILVISIAGGLYIVSFPVTLYYAEFLGILLLFVGFGGLPSALAARTTAPLASRGAS